MEDKAKTKEEEHSPRLTLEQLGCVPVECPWFDCRAKVCSEHLLRHLLYQHHEKNIMDAYEGEQCLLMCDPSDIPLDHTMLFAVLLYGGRGDAVDPGNRGLCHKNCLPNNSDFASRENYLPVLLFARKCADFMWLKDKPESEEDKEAAQNELHREAKKDQNQWNPGLEPEYLFWSQSVACTKPLYATITAFDGNTSESRGAIRRVANSGMLHNEIEGKELPKSRHALSLKQSDVEELTGTYPKFMLEVILNENPLGPQARADAEAKAGAN